MEKLLQSFVSDLKRGKRLKIYCIRCRNWKNPLDFGVERYFVYFSIINSKGEELTLPNFPFTDLENKIKKSGLYYYLADGEEFFEYAFSGNNIKEIQKSILKNFNRKYFIIKNRNVSSWEIV